MFYKWEKNLPISNNISPLLTNELFRWFLLYPDARFMIQWHHLFPDTKQHEKAGWSIPKQRSRREAREKLSGLRKRDPEARYRLVPTLLNRYIIYSESVCLFITDQLAGWIVETVSHFYCYYDDKMPKKEEINKYVRKALLEALIDNHPWLRLSFWIKTFATESKLDPFYYWGSFWKMDMCQRFKEYLYIAIGRPTANLEKLDDERFIAEFEEEWQRAVNFQDLRGGFHIMPLMPLFTPNDMVRYAHLSRSNPKIEYRMIQDLVWQMIDYVVLKICPKLFETIDHLEPRRFQKWQKLLLELMRPLVDQVLRKQERIMNQGREEKSKRELTQKDKQGVRKNIESRILSLATKKYYYLYEYEKKEIPWDIRALMKEWELNGKKMRASEKKQGFYQQKWSCAKKSEDLAKKILEKIASWVGEGDGSWINYYQPYLPWGHFLGLDSDEEIKEIKERGAYPRKALLKRTENLLREYRKAEEEKNWRKAKELLRKLREVEREREAGQSVLRAREKSRWVRPSYFIYQKIRKDYLFQEDTNSFPGKGFMPNHWQDLESLGDEDLDNRVAKEALAVGATSPQEFTEYASLEKLNQKRLLDKNVVIEDDSGYKREYVRLGKLADMVGCSPKTLIRMEERGEIKFEWRRVKGGEIQTEGKGVGKRGRWMRLFPVEKIDEIRCCFLKDRNIAKIARVRADYLPKLKKKRGFDELPRLEQKKKLLEWAKQRKKKRR